MPRQQTDERLVVARLAMANTAINHNNKQPVMRNLLEGSSWRSSDLRVLPIGIAGNNLKS